MSDAGSPPRSPEAPTLARLQQVVDILEEGVAILGADGVVEFINPSGEAILHVPAGQLLGWRLLDFRWEIVDEVGAPLPRTALPPLKVLETGEPHEMMVVGMTSPAVPEVCWVEVSARPLHAEDGSRPHGAVTSFRDVTDRMNAQLALRRSEERYQSLAQTVPTGIFHVDDRGACVWVNDAMEEITGVPAERYLGDGWLSTIHPEDRDMAGSEWAATAGVGRPYILEHRILRPDGDVRWVICRAAPQIDPQGRGVGYVGSVTDITEAKTAAQMKDQLIGLVSHELRAPLVSIRGGLSFLEPYIRDADEDGRRLYEMAVRNAQLLERLVRDLLDIERLEAGRLTLDIRQVVLAELLGDAREVILPMAEERGVEVVIGDAADVTLAADRDRLLQVVTNLLSNAVKFSEPGGRVTVDVARSGGQVLFSVRDQGRGIPQEFHERIFERFGQVNSADAAERGGAGLGLAISRAIVQHHGGRIQVESAPGAGATFTVTLPSG